MVGNVNWFITGQNVTVNYDGQTHIVNRDEPLANDLIKAIKEGRNNDIPNLISVAAAMENKSKGEVVVRDGEILVKGVKVPTELARKIQSFIDEGLPYQPLVKFAENLQDNPSYRSVNELFQFLEKNDHPFTENGNFIAYKRVRANFKDIHSGTFDNSPGNTLEVPRNQVDEDSSRTCSHGLHVANWDYAHTQFASHDASSDIMLEVEVNPADVVAIPSDYNQSKMRVCKYKVLGVVKTEYKGSSLRVVDPEKYEVFKSDEEDVEYCIECDNECDPGEELCWRCQDDEDEEETNYCDECGQECETDYALCYDCEVAEEEEEEEEEDTYPYEDELEEGE